MYCTVDESSEGNVQTASAWHPVGSRAQDSSESSEEEEEEEKEEDKSKKNYYDVI